MACIICNAVLIGASGWAMYVIKPADSPYAFTACTVGLLHGIFGFVDGLKGEEGEGCCAKAKEITTNVMELVPLPLVNIDLFLKSEESATLALGHGLYIVPYCLTLVIGDTATGESAEGEESEGEPQDNIEVLKHLTILGNIWSLVFLAVNESNYLYGGMALAAFITKYGAMFMESMSEGTGWHTTILGHSVFNFLTSKALGKSE